MSNAKLVTVGIVMQKRNRGYSSIVNLHTQSRFFFWLPTTLKPSSLTVQVRGSTNEHYNCWAIGLQPQRSPSKPGCVTRGNPFYLG